MSIKSSLEGIKNNTIIRAVFYTKSGKAGLTILLIFGIIAIIGPYIAPYKPYEQFTAYQPPSLAHPLGTDYFGYDVLTWLLIGTRVSTIVGYLAGLGTAILALILALLGGYYEGTWLGNTINAIIDIFLVIPGLPLLIILAYYFKLYSIYGVIIGIIIISWPYSARVLRAQVQSLRNRDFVTADKTLGMSDWKVIIKDILPNMTSLIFSIFLFSAIGAILTEASLDFIGLGDVNTISWGTMIYWANDEMAYGQNVWWWFIPPGLAIGLVGAGFVLINLALDEVTNPKISTLKIMKKAKKILKGEEVIIPR